MLVFDEDRLGRRMGFLFLLAAPLRVNGFSSNALYGFRWLSRDNANNNPQQRCWQPTNGFALFLNLKISAGSRPPRFVCRFHELQFGLNLCIGAECTYLPISNRYIRAGSVFSVPFSLFFRVENNGRQEQTLPH